MKKALLLCGCLYLVLSGSAAAEIEVPEHSVQLGAETYYFEYEEPTVMREDGAMYGLAGSYTFRDKLMLRAEGRSALGEVDYKNSGTINDIPDFTMELRGLAGWGFPVYDSSLITPYAGLAYRYLNDDSKGMTSSTGAVGYERESNYFYSPIGVEMITDIDNGWSIGFTAEYDLFWKGVQKSHLSDVNRSFNDVENDQNKGYGLRGSVKLSKQLENIGFTLEPFVRYWNIKQSENANVTYAGTIVGYGYEPKNNTTEAGVKFLVNF